MEGGAASLWPGKLRHASGLNMVVLEKKLRSDMQLLIVEGATHGLPGRPTGRLKAQAGDELRKFLASHSAHLGK